MKKKLLIFFLIMTMFISIFQYRQHCQAVAGGIGIGITEGLITAFDSLVAGYGATKGLQFGSSITQPEIIGDYTKPYTYSNESITGLRPLWDSFSDDYVRDNWNTLFPSASSYEDALLQWSKEKGAFMDGCDAGFFITDQIGKKAFEVFNEWVFSLAGTEYIKSVENPVYSGFSNGSTNFYLKEQVNSNGVWSYPVAQCTVTIPEIENYHVVGVSNFNPQTASYTGSCAGGLVTYKHNTDEWFIVLACELGNTGGWNIPGKPSYWAGWNGSVTWSEVTSPSYASQYGILGDAGVVATTSGRDASDATKQDVVLYDETTEGESITQMPIGNPDNHDDKDNKKLTVLPNVPGLSGLDPLQLPGANGGRLPFNYPPVDPVTGQYPPISVSGNGGVTINIPVTNNDYKVINNYDEHSDYYNENYSYPTINYNTVNYYVNEGAMTYEQFLTALQDYFNVLVYNNTNNNYYPTTVNETTNNYYNITEVINDRIPPILPPATISIVDRFPFSIPFDLYKLLCLFNAEPHYWEWDVPVPTFQEGGTSNEFYHGEVGHFDFSSTVHISLEQWDVVALVLRTMLSVLWSTFLYFLFWKFTHPN